jgi:DNA-binding NarL/FixJ family response regulator
MRRQHGMRTHPPRQGSIGAHHVRVLLVADQRALVTRRRRRALVADASPDRAAASDKPSVVATPNPLSAREQEVLGMLVRGLRNKEIANHLFITDRTVKFHAQAIYRKLGVANRTEAVCVALRQGLVALDPSVPPASDTT